MELRRLATFCNRLQLGCFRPPVRHKCRGDLPGVQPCLQCPRHLDGERRFAPMWTHSPKVLALECRYREGAPVGFHG